MTMNIGEAARRSGVPAKTIRYYESIHLIPEPARRDNGYRTYSERDVDILRFVSRARSLGFSMRDVSSLLALWQDSGRASADVKAVALRNIDRINRKIAELVSIRDILGDLAERCHGDQRPDCPIIEELAAVVRRSGEESGEPCHQPVPAQSE